MPIKHTLVIADDGTTSGTTEDQSILQTGIEIVTLPLGITASSNEVVQKKTAAMSVLGFSVASFFSGEAWGHKRERQGKLSFVPMFRS